ncbi:hypothetical protein F5H01DRAFT_104278 [Linnemannia elongata]|nr:hypothetical protein F5H01DRAFT_104278 [Linnemannia elongata]
MFLVFSPHPSPILFLLLFFLFHITLRPTPSYSHPRSLSFSLSCSLFINTLQTSSRLFLLSFPFISLHSCSYCCTISLPISSFPFPATFSFVLRPSLLKNTSINFCLLHPSSYPLLFMFVF